MQIFPEAQILQVIDTIQETSLQHWALYGMLYSQKAPDQARAVKHLKINKQESGSNGVNSRRIAVCRRGLEETLKRPSVDMKIGVI